MNMNSSASQYNSFSIHSKVIGEESTFEYPNPDPDFVPAPIDEASIASSVSENFEGCMEKIHESSRIKYIRMVGELTYATRINLYKVLGSLDWSDFYCAFMLELFDHVGKERRELLIHTTITLYGNRRPLYLDIIKKLKEPQLDEFLSSTPLDLVHHFIEICYYLNPFEKEFDTFLEMVSSLSFKEVNDIMNIADEPFAKHCRLCRAKRLHTLEYRMQQGQIRPEHGETPGVVVQYETADNWRADGEHFFTFDYENCLVFWRKKQVDLVKICDGCLNDTHRAMAEVNRFESVNHLEGVPKKEFCTELRHEEKERALMFQQLSVTRLQRRCKEWAIRAQKSLREGYIREAQERQAATDKIIQDRAVAEKKDAASGMLKAVKRIDKAWVKHEKGTQQERNKKRYDGACLKFKDPYTRENPVAPTLEHPHSWKLAGYDANGLPASKEASTERFGTGKLKPDVRTAELTLWKQQSAYLHKNYLDKVAAEERCKSEERTKEAQLYNKIIADNEFSMNRAAKLKRLADEQAEEDRLEARADDRRRRRLARLKAAEESETQMMESEDKRSWEHRYYLKECTIIERELRNMRAQERAQRSIDQFWGIPTHIVGRKNAKDVENAVWREKMENLRAIGMQTGVWVPYKAEVGEFRDSFTGLAIKEPKHVREFEHYKEPGPASNQYTHYNYTYKYEDLESKRTGTAGSTKRGIK